jgi:hypothetical protein
MWRGEDHGARPRSAAVLVALALLLASARHAAAQFSTDGPLLAKQLVELAGMHRELRAASGLMARVSAATAEVALRYRQIEGAIRVLQSYGPEALWRDFKEDFYDTYPGFELLGQRSKAASWRLSRTGVPQDAYRLISQVFGELTEGLRQKEQDGKLDTSEARISQFEAAGAMALASSSEVRTRAFDADARHLYQQAERARTGDEAAVVSAKALALLAVQQSYVIRLLSRQVRLEGVDYAMRYQARMSELRGLTAVEKATGQMLRDAAGPPRLLQFEPVW